MPLNNAQTWRFLWARNSAWIEYPTSNRLVVGSNPTVPAIFHIIKKMSILSIENIFQDESNTVTVNAAIEDMIVVIPQTYNYPAEYGPALCEASFELDEDEILPDNEYELIQFLERLDLDWNIIDTKDY